MAARVESFFESFTQPAHSAAYSAFQGAAGHINRWHSTRRFTFAARCLSAAVSRCLAGACLAVECAGISDATAACPALGADSRQLVKSGSLVARARAEALRWD